MRRLWRSIWASVGSVPLGLKIMGIVVFPLILIGFVAIVYIRHEVIMLLETHVQRDVLLDVYPLITRRLATWLAITSLAGITLALGLSYVLVRPLRQLLNVIQRVESGDLSARVGVWANDEIGRVQAAFNRMTRNLEQSHRDLTRRNQELTTLNELAEIVSLGKNLDSVLSTSLTRALALMEADAGSIYLLEDNRQIISRTIAQGTMSSELALETEHIPIDNTPMQRVIESGRSLALDDLSQAPELSADTARLLGQSGFAAWACTPLHLQGKVIGTINIGRRNRQPFNQKDLTLLEAVANVVATGIFNAQLLDSLRRQEAELRRALLKTVQVQEDERRRLSRELHDEAGQALTAILLRLQTLQNETDPEVITSRIGGLRYLTAQTLEELRRLSMDLRPAALDNLGIVPVLRWYIQQCADHTDMPITFTGPDSHNRLPPDIEVALYRIAQEGITNAIRHSQAQHVNVMLEQNPTAVWLTITDDGRGFDLGTHDPGLGLVGIRERVSALNGTVSLETTPGAGTHLSVVIPLQGELTHD